MIASAASAPLYLPAFIILTLESINLQRCLTNAIGFVRLQHGSENSMSEILHIPRQSLNKYTYLSLRTMIDDTYITYHCVESSPCPFSCLVLQLYAAQMVKAQKIRFKKLIAQFTLAAFVSRLRE